MSGPAVDLEEVRWLTFDCYGTLVDWEEGILSTFVPLLRERGARVGEGRILEWYARFEAEEEEGPWRPYREVLGRVSERLMDAAGAAPEQGDRERLADGLPSWPVFPDTREALTRLGSRFGLVVVSNVDDDLFRGTAHTIGVPFHAVVTAEQAGAYKPSHRPFELALERLGARPAEVVHVAQSLFHDHVPAGELGWTSIRVDRPSRLAGRGLAPEVRAAPAAEVTDLASVADLLLG